MKKSVGFCIVFFTMLIPCTLHAGEIEVIEVIGERPSLVDSDSIFWGGTGGGGSSTTFGNPPGGAAGGGEGAPTPVPAKDEGEVEKENEENKKKAKEEPWYIKVLKEASATVKAQMKELLKAVVLKDIESQRIDETTINADGSVTIRSSCKERITTIGGASSEKPCTSVRKEPVEVTGPGGTTVKFKITLSPVNFDGEEIVFIVGNEEEFLEIFEETIAD